MLEESLNFGMNAVQLSKVSSLQSHVSELDKSLQNILDNLNSMHQEQAGAIEKQEQEHQKQEKEYQKQQQILKLRESIFNFKTSMGDVYQSNKFAIENKYLQFRDACRSSAIQVLNPNYFDTFEDKEYVISVKKYLIETRDELFDNLDNNKKSIAKSLEGKEKQLKEIVNMDRQKPDLLSEPLIDRSKLKNIDKPIQPKGYYAEFEIERALMQNDFVKIFILIPLTAGVGIWVFMSTQHIIGRFVYAVLSMQITYFVLAVLVALQGFFLDKKKEKFSNYKNLLSEYLKQKEFNKNLLKEYEDQLQYYKDHKKTISQNYQNELKRYQGSQDDIKTLEQEIIGLYQSFSN